MDELSQIIHLLKTVFHSNNDYEVMEASNMIKSIQMNPNFICQIISLIGNQEIDINIRTEAIIILKSSIEQKYTICENDIFQIFRNSDLEIAPHLFHLSRLIFRYFSKNQTWLNNILTLISTLLQHKKYGGAILYFGFCNEIDSIQTLIPDLQNLLLSISEFALPNIFDLFNATENLWISYICLKTLKKIFFIISNINPWLDIIRSNFFFFKFHDILLSSIFDFIAIAIDTFPNEIMEFLFFLIKESIIYIQSIISSYFEHGKLLISFFRLVRKIFTFSEKQTRIRNNFELFLIEVFEQILSSIFLPLFALPFQITLDALDSEEFLCYFYNNYFYDSFSPFDDPKGSAFLTLKSIFFYHPDYIKLSYDLANNSYISHNSSFIFSSFLILSTALEQSLQYQQMSLNNFSSLIKNTNSFEQISFFIIASCSNFINIPNIIEELMNILFSSSCFLLNRVFAMLTLSKYILSDSESLISIIKTQYLGSIHSLILMLISFISKIFDPNLINFLSTLTTDPEIAGFLVSISSTYIEYLSFFIESFIENRLSNNNNFSFTNIFCSFNSLIRVTAGNAECDLLSKQIMTLDYHLLEISGIFFLSCILDNFCIIIRSNTKFHNEYWEFINYFFRNDDSDTHQPLIYLFSAIEVETLSLIMAEMIERDPQLFSEQQFQQMLIIFCNTILSLNIDNVIFYSQPFLCSALIVINPILIQDIVIAIETGIVVIWRINKLNFYKNYRKIINILMNMFSDSFLSTLGPSRNEFFIFLEEESLEPHDSI